MRILIADDHAQNRYLLEQILALNGHATVSVENGREALERMRAEPCDLVVSDILMPEMDGFQLCREVRADERLKDTPFVFYTATYTDPKDEQFAYELGADGFMIKPTEPELFMPKLEEFLRRRKSRPAGNAPAEVRPETEILQTYNQRLIHKLESKIAELEKSREETEAANRKVGALNAELMSAITALRESEARFREVFQHSSDCIAVFSARTDGGFAYEGINLAAEELLGLKNKDVWGRAPEAVLPPERAAVVRALLTKCRDTRQPLTVDDTLLLEDRPRHFSALYVPIDGDGRIHRIAIISRDITAARQAADNQRRLEEQLFESQKMEALGTLCGGISHDFNNLLGAILGNAEMATLDLPESHPATQSVTEIRKASLRARDLVLQILTFSRRNNRQRDPVRLQKPVHEALGLFRSTLPSGVELVTDLAADCPPVRADASQMHQVVMNLVTNAWHALPSSGGRIAVALHPVEIGLGAVERQPELSPGRYVRLSVTDNGAGMDERTVSRAFEPFFTTKEPGRGTGLGLAVVHGIVKSHHGCLTVESAPGKGTRFDLWLPVADDAAPGARSSDTAFFGRTVMGQGQKLLFVDDEVSLVSNAKRMLEPSGYRFTGFSDSREALRELREHAADYDLLVTDVVMPHVGGIELIREARRLRPELPVLVTTGYSEELTDDVMRELRIGRVLTKPHTLAEMLAAVHQTLQSPQG